MDAVLLAGQQARCPGLRLPRPQVPAPGALRRGGEKAVISFARGGCCSSTLCV